MPHRSRTRLCHLVSALAIVATACGGSSGSADPATTATATTAAITTRSDTTTPPTTTPPPTDTTTTVAPTTTEAPDLERLARSVLMVGISGTTLDGGTAAHLAAGGRAVILFSSNISDAAGLTTLTSDVSCAVGGPALVAVDQELSPQVRRLSDGLVSDLPSPEQALTMSLEEVRAAGRRLATELLNLGITMNLAPVIDVVRGANPVLNGRHLGPDPEIVAAVGTAFLEGMADGGVVGVPKHFPGHGLSTTDPHSGSTVIEASAEALAEVDWVPFEAAFASGTGAVMIGHPIYTSLDPDVPASLSPAVLSLLRDRFGFEGVAITDSLSMEAVSAGYAPGESAARALEAGQDLLLVQDPAQVEVTVDALITALNAGDLPLERLIEASNRVDALADSVPTFCSE